MAEHVSFSAWKTFQECPYKFKIEWDDRVSSFEGNLHTAFGTGIHRVAEVQVGERLLLKEDKSPINKAEGIDYKQVFLEEFKKAVLSIPKEEVDPAFIKELAGQADNLYSQLMPALDNFFGTWEPVGVETQLYEPITIFKEANLKFKGFVDLIIRTPEDNKLHIIDWKTCSWGWNARKKADPLYTYQLTYYKHFTCQKLGLDPKQVETYFALVKRTKKEDSVEIFRVTSGPKKTKNALEKLKTLCNAVHKKHYPKNKMACAVCPYRKTEHCP